MNATTELTHPDNADLKIKVYKAGEGDTTGIDVYVTISDGQRAMHFPASWIERTIWAERLKHADAA